VPVELGVAMNEASMQGLPAAHGDGQGHEMMTEYLLPLPEQAKTFTPYRVVELDWTPMGHEPPGIYDHPHFDFHFYTITEAERNAIDASDPRFEEKAANTPPADYVPQGYILPAPVAIPRMGAHWIDPTSPELNGATFTTTFIMGSWDGKMIFTEPMITRAFLRSQPNFTGAIAQSAKYVTPGYRPTQYSIRWDAQAKEIRVALQSFVNHP
jgi:hypothetical protein